MKYVVCVPDGCSDEPLAELGGRTPLQACGAAGGIQRSAPTGGLA